MPAAIPLAIAAGSAISGIVGAKVNSNASRDAANAQIQGQNKSAELQAQAARESLAFQKEQAAREQQNFTDTQLANYGQYADRQNRIGSLGSLLGLPNRVAPPPPSYLTGGSTSSPSGAAAGGGDPKVGAFIQQWQATHAPSEGIAPLAEAISKQFPNVSRYMYGQTPSDNELSIGGQKFKVLGAEKTPGAYWYVPGTNDSPGGVRKAPAAYTAPLSAAFAPVSAQAFTPALQMPQPYGVVR